MATIFIIVALTVLVANSVIMRSKTPWWRNPAALFRPEEPEGPAPHPAAEFRKPADWVRAAQARSAEMSRASAVARPVAPPRAMATPPSPPPAQPRRPVQAQHPVRDDDAVTEVFGRVSDDEAPTRMLQAVPAGYPDAPGSR